MQKMEKSNRLKDLKAKKIFPKDQQRHKIVVEELNKFNTLVKEHRKILEAIGSL